MKQTIRFSGLNLALDEQAAENGSLAVCEGMELHGGALRPCVIEGEATPNKIEGEILYIHELTNGKKNAIYVDDTLHTLYYIDITGIGKAVALDSGQTVISRDMINAVTSNGNTLVLLTTMGIKYFRWYNNTYKYLDEMPELEMEFSLSESTDTIMSDFGYPASSMANKNYIHKVSYIMLDKARYDVDKEVHYYDSENLLVREEAMDAALGKAKQICNKAKYFALPFFIRYCYRLWDGRKVMHSAPVLMFSDITHPETAVVGYDTASPQDHWNFGFLLPQKLNVKVWNEDAIDAIKNDWVDIIRSIDVYITPEISRKDDSVKVEIPESGTNYPWSGKWEHIYYYGGTVPETEDSMTLFGKDNNLNDDIEYNYSKLTFHGKFGDIEDLDTQDHRGWDAPVPTFKITGRGREDYSKVYGVFRPKEVGDKLWQKRLVEQNAYYLLKRYELVEDDVPTTGVFPIEDGTLENIEAQEQMITSTAPDDYRTHNKIVAKSSYVYNNRVNLTGIQEILFNGFPIYCIRQRAGRGANITKVVVRLEENGKNIYIQRDYRNFWEDIRFLNKTFLFYPDTRAKEMWIYTTAYSKPHCHFALMEHPLLNGAYHMDDIYNFTNATHTNDEDAPAPTEDPRFNLPNYIFTSASGNPFVFPAAHRYAVGLGEVKAIASTTRALSQGQFGQYPMIAFASDGIYALDVSPTGSYSGIQPISREVITNAKALLQLDQSIAFITRRAINQLISSDVNELSAALSGPLRNLKDMLKGRDKDGNVTDVLPETRQVPDLIAAVQNADAVYDFVDSRLLYFLKDDNGAYTGDVLAFCTTDTAWVFKYLGNDDDAKIGIRGVYNSYPYPYIHHKDGTLYCLSAPYDNRELGDYDGIIITRTIKAEGVRSAIREFFQDYDIYIDKDWVAEHPEDDPRPTLMLWGSDDNRTWHYIGKSNARQMGRLPGRIYRYFRFAVQFQNMKRNDLYHAVQLDIQERFTR